MTDQRQLDSFTYGYVRKSARQLVGKYGFKPDDREEIEQQLYLKLVKHLPSADAESPRWKAFVATTIKRAIANLIRDQQAEKRDPRGNCSIHVVVGVDDHGPVELAATISDAEDRSHRGQEVRPQQESTELRLDLEAALDEIADERLREYCRRLKHDNLSQVARDMNIPRTTLIARLRKLRSVFEDKDLREYL